MPAESFAGEINDVRSGKVCAFQDCSRSRSAAGLLAGTGFSGAGAAALVPWHDAQARISPGWNVTR